MSLALTIAATFLAACAPTPQQQHAPCYVVPIGYVMPYDKYTPYFPCPPSFPATNLSQVGAIPAEGDGDAAGSTGGTGGTGGAPGSPSSGPEREEAEAEAAKGAKGSQTEDGVDEASSTGENTPAGGGAHAVKDGQVSETDASKLRK